MLNTILVKIEHLQGKTKDTAAKERLLTAHNELLKLKFN
jgi:hypothetical protein